MGNEELVASKERVEIAEALADTGVDERSLVIRSRCRRQDHQVLGTFVRQLEIELDALAVSRASATVLMATAQNGDGISIQLGRT